MKGYVLSAVAAVWLVALAMTARTGFNVAFFKPKWWMSDWLAWKVLWAVYGLVWFGWLVPLSLAIWQFRRTTR